MNTAANAEHGDGDLEPAEAELSSLLDELTNLRQDMLASRDGVPDFIHPDFLPSAHNLLQYLVLRHRDLRRLQGRLARLGLSSLGRSESHVMASVEAVLSTLDHLARDSGPLPDVSAMAAGERRLQHNLQNLLGPSDTERDVRIMVTMPSEAASDYDLVHDLLQSGMDCMRINCAHDNEMAWSKMIEHLRQAERMTGRKCKVLFDLAGPKIRTGRICPGPRVLRCRPGRDVFGNVLRPARIWMSEHLQRYPAPTSAQAELELPRDWLDGLSRGDRVVFNDTRGAHRTLTVVDVSSRGCWLESRKTSYIGNETGLLHVDASGVEHGPVFPLGIPPRETAIPLLAGDALFLSSEDVEGSPAALDSAGQILRPATISCTLPEVLEQAAPGESVWFDDGKIWGVVEQRQPGGLLVRIRRTPPGGGILRADKGINLPGTSLQIGAITEKDKADLAFVYHHADMVGLSFANSVQDIQALKENMAKLGDRQPAIILKIETVRGFRNLPAMLLEAMSAPACGVMIARGDLAVECGFERLAEVQEEILWLCEAAHVPVIWATQVLESLAKTGAPTRAEITDAAMGHRAECVMLNKGPNIVNTVKTLDDIMRRMQGHQMKKQWMLRELSLARDFAPLH